MSPITQLLFNIGSLVFSAMMGIGAIVLVIKRPKNLAEEMRDCIKLAVDELRHEFREEIKTCRSDSDRKCSEVKSDLKREITEVEKRIATNCIEKHSKIDGSLTELYNENKTLVKEQNKILSNLSENFAKWQQSMERQMGNHDGRITSLEHK